MVFISSLSLRVLSREGVGRPGDRDTAAIVLREFVELDFEIDLVGVVGVGGVFEGPEVEKERIRSCTEGRLDAVGVL